MADRILSTGNWNNIDEKYKDMGDGTFAKVGYSFISSDSDNLSISIDGRTPDPTKNLVQNFGDGTTQTIYFDSSGEWAGRSERV